MFVFLCDMCVGGTGLLIASCASCVRFGFEGGCLLPVPLCRMLFRLTYKNDHRFAGNAKYPLEVF